MSEYPKFCSEDRREVSASNEFVEGILQTDPFLLERPMVLRTLDLYIGTTESNHKAICVVLAPATTLDRPQQDPFGLETTDDVRDAESATNKESDAEDTLLLSKLRLLSHPDLKQCMDFDKLSTVGIHRIGAYGRLIDGDTWRYVFEIQGNLYKTNRSLEKQTKKIPKLLENPLEVEIQHPDPYRTKIKTFFIFLLNQN